LLLTHNQTKPTLAKKAEAQEDDKLQDVAERQLKEAAARIEAAAQVKIELN
jgi:hypothetical protein